MPAQKTIALLGAPGSGALALAEALQRQLAGSAMTAKVIAVADAPQLPAELRHALHSAAITLLMGLDLPCAAPEQTRREECDAHLRVVLADAAVRYHVVYGHGAERIENALKAINSIAIKPYVTSANDSFDAKTMRLRAWECEKCSDPDCEHRLFSSLTGRSG